MANEIDMKLEDQQNINLFGRLVQRSHEVEAELNNKQKLAEDLEDASNELMLVDEEEVHYVVGQCFYNASIPEAEEKIQESVEETTTELARLKAELESIKSKMADLKKVLYGKFGDSINLEE